MVHIDRPDDRRIAIEHIRRVPAAAHAHFDHGDIDRSIGELPDGHSRQHFEEAHFRLALLRHRRVDKLHEIPDLFPGVDEIVIAQLLAVNRDALVDALKMRRGVQPGAHAVRPADGLGHACRRAFAVGAGDVDDAERVLRMPQQVEHHRHAVEIEIRGVMLRGAAHDIAFDLADRCLALVRMLI